MKQNGYQAKAWHQGFEMVCALDLIDISAPVAEAETERIGLG